MQTKGHITSIYQIMALLILSALTCSAAGCDDPKQRSSDDASAKAGVGDGGEEGGASTAGVTSVSSGGVELQGGGAVAAGGRDGGAQAGAVMSGAEAGTQAGSAQSGEEAGESGIQAGHEPAGVQAGGVSSPPPEEEVTCLRSCVDFVECAVERCEGYDEGDIRFLMNECLSVCLDPIAQAFDRLKNCDDKLRFAFTLRPDFGEFCGSVSEGFCETYTSTCGPWMGEVSCEVHYNDAPERGAALSAGAHRACYEYHLGDARRALTRGDQEEAQQACERAAGRSICVDE